MKLKNIAIGALAPALALGLAARAGINGRHLAMGVANVQDDGFDFADKKILLSGREVAAGRDLQADLLRLDRGEEFDAATERTVGHLRADQHQDDCH